MTMIISSKRFTIQSCHYNQQKTDLKWVGFFIFNYYSLFIFHPFDFAQGPREEVTSITNRQYLSTFTNSIVKINVLCAGISPAAYEP